MLICNRKAVLAGISRRAIEQRSGIEMQNQSWFVSVRHLSFPLQLQIDGKLLQNRVRVSKGRLGHAWCGGPHKQWFVANPGRVYSA